MNPRWRGLALVPLFWLVFGSPSARGGDPQASPEEPGIPPTWRAAWADPPPEQRPLQIIHGIQPQRGRSAGSKPGAAGQDDAGQDGDPFVRLMRSYKDRGLGGVVCNVAFSDYLQSEENWRALAGGVEACRKLGMIVWLYDEEGYPSGAAGGLVLKADPQFEATALALDRARPDPFLLRPAYEHTHASNNFFAARRYVNLLDDRAVRSFLDKTHEAYRRRLGKYFGPDRTVRAMFTDEPSLIAVNLGQLPESVRKGVRVADAIDPAVRPLPSVPWGYDVARQYRERYGRDLLAERRSLFEGDSAEDRRVREQFWGLVADLVAERYFGAIQKWCAESKIASSGHTLWEEALMHHPALEGNALKVLSRMDIPGLDMLSSDPEVVIHSGWLNAALPGSAAMLTGGRRVMTEISDFSEKMGGRGPASLADMQAAAAWQAAWGVTEFTLYYGLGDRPAEAARSYGDYVGRLNAILRPAQWQADVLLYYPVRDLWAEYRPVAEPLAMASQTPRARRIVGSFMRLGQTLQRSQVPFALVDHEFLAAGTAEGDGKLAIGKRRFGRLVLPEDVRLPAQAASVVEQFRQKGGRVLADGPQGARLSPVKLLDAIEPACRLAPESPHVALGRFERDGRTVLLVANVGQQPYRGQLSVGGPGTWISLDPASGAVSLARPAGAGAAADAGRLPLTLAARQAILLVRTR